MNENVRKHEYFYLKLGVPRGPFTEQEFVELAKKGKIKASTSCIRNDEPSKPANVFFGKSWDKIEAFRKAAKDKAVNAKAELKKRKEVEKQKNSEERQQRKEITQKAVLERKNAIRVKKKLQEENNLRAFINPLIWQGHPSALYYWKYHFFAIGCFSVTMFCLLFGGVSRIGGIGLLVGAIGACPLIYAILDQKTRVYKLLNDRIEMTRGIIARQVVEIEIVNIRAVAMEQSFLERIFGLGQVKVGSAGTSNYEIIFFGVRQPEDVKEMIRKTRQL
jgi:membrane protein YdbS with pleckstrin-like domain